MFIIFNVCVSVGAKFIHKFVYPSPAKCFPAIPYISIFMETQSINALASRLGSDVPNRLRFKLLTIIKFISDLTFNSYTRFVEKGLIVLPARAAQTRPESMALLHDAIFENYFMRVR